MTTDLAPLQQPPEDISLIHIDQDAAYAVATGLRDAKADNTRRAYASAWRRFERWAEDRGQRTLPAAPETIALHLGQLRAGGMSMGSIDQARSAISHFHAAAGIQQPDNPAHHPAVAEAIKGWRKRAPAPTQEDALTSEALARIREILRVPRRGRGGKMETPEGARRRGAVDLAIIGVLADGGLRRAEAAALTWGDVEFWPDGTGRITIRKGKNQIEPATVAVTAATARAGTEIRP